MVSANSLNLDVVEMICSYLSQSDLAAVTLVNRFFLTGAIPTLYRSLPFRVRHAKRYPSVSSSFATILAHPDIAAHVRSIDIHNIPSLCRKANPDFVRDFTDALKLCNNLRSFVYTPTSLLAISAVLPMLDGKQHLRNIRISAKLAASQAATLVKFNQVERLELDHASWGVLDTLPRWAERIKKTLTTLTLFSSMDLNYQLLEMVLKQLPQLQGLHVLCPGIDHTKMLKLVMHTPRLESLAFTVTELAQAPDLPTPAPTLSMLRHLALDVRLGFTADPGTPTTILAVLTILRAGFATLTSVALKIFEITLEAGHAVMVKLIKDHAGSLERLCLASSALEMRSIVEISQKCRKLGVLSMPLPMKEIHTFGNALSSSRSVHTLIDGDGHTAHGSRPSLNQTNVAMLMQRVPTLVRIVDDKRLWTGRRDSGGGCLRVALERKTAESSAQWFMPPQ
ncbi:hypothetical protein DXG01_014971 [Tephrocybe rancida]|nr:hypothetical protein DXG01_014971 [Tephrocybe rancida]